jgi:hypothetical protein
LLDILLDT